MFEQSGTFKNEFKKLGYDAVDLDIQNNFGETDYVIDLFAEIEKAYQGGGGKRLGLNQLRGFGDCLFSVYLLQPAKYYLFRWNKHQLERQYCKRKG